MFVLYPEHAQSNPRTRKTAGTMNRVKSVPIDSPVSSTMPIARRPAAPAPVAMANGTTPNTIAAVVIRIGRRRTAAASSMAASFAIPCRCSSLANCTIRMPCLLMRPSSVTNPTCV
jgi:hypothetical protein